MTILKIKEQVRDGALRKNPSHEKWLSVFTHGFSVVWGRDEALMGSLVTTYLLDADNAMSDQFGFDPGRNVLLIYSQYERLEPRTMQIIDQLARGELKARVDPLTVFLVSRDSTCGSWVQDYLVGHDAGRLVVGFSVGELLEAGDISWRVRHILASRLYQADLFGDRLPLRSDSSFVGRTQILGELLGAVRRGENRGLFGLRKVGKTSTLFKLLRQVAEEQGGVASIYLDCKLPHIYKRRWYELLSWILERLGGERLTAPSERSISEAWYKHFQDVQPDQRVVLVFDEIEFITPVSQMSNHWEADFFPFWQVIWGVQSEFRYLSVVAAGVNPHCVEKPNLGRNALQNPLFGVVPVTFLKGLEEDDVNRLTRRLGRRMGLQFDTATTQYLLRRYRGHPLLTRMACSALNQELVAEDRVRPARVRVDDFERKERTRESELLIFYAEHILTELEQYAPDEYQLLEKIATGQLADYFEFATSPLFSRYLRQLELLELDSGGRPTITIPILKQLVGLRAARSKGRELMLETVPSARRAEWLEARKREIADALRSFEAVGRERGLASLFGPNSFPEQFEFRALQVVKSSHGFTPFIVQLNRCFVESVDVWGRSQGKPKYFFEDIRKAFPAVFEALHRIRVYRNYESHITLASQVSEDFRSFLATDLEGRDPSKVGDREFVLQQRCLDELLSALLAETDRLS